jgi:hypothetical protein
MIETLYASYLSFLILSVLISTYVAFRLFAQPSTIKSQPTKFVVPLTISVGLTLVSWILYVLLSAIPRVNFSCLVDSYSVPALLSCEDLDERTASTSQWHIYRNGNIEISSHDGLRFSANITEPGKYDIWHSLDVTFLFLPLHTFASSYPFYFGTAEDVSGTEMQIFDFKMDKKPFVAATCEYKSFSVKENERIKYAYIRQVQVLYANITVLLIAESTVTVSSCFGTEVTPLRLVIELERASVSGQLVLGVERK